MNRYLRIFIAVASLAASAHAQYFKSVEEAHSPGEEHLSFDLVMKPYPIPAETTTYVDFVFNLPEDLPEVFHITYGEVINSQPEHLHHFGLIGCPYRVDPDQANLPVDTSEMRLGCAEVLGFWAPGTDLFGNTDLDTGILMGRGMGIGSLQLNVHYTDGVYADEASKKLKMATDGIRIHYTPVFRPYSSVFKPLMNLIRAPRQLQIPAGEPRFFISKQCQVETSCKDADAETLGFIASFLGFGDEVGAGLTCESLALFCGLGGVEGGYIKRLCPKTCGLCEAPEGDDGTVNPFDPGSYRVTAVWYHAHLLGREMYTTLIRGGDGKDQDDQVVVTPKQASPIVQDLQSRDFWIFDNQETIPLEFDGIVENGTLMRGTEIHPGDKIQATCVFDATHRDEPTNIYLSTYDEMCANIFHVTFPTPPRLLESGGGDDDDDAALDLATELQLMNFACGSGPESDVYAGTLAPDEDGRDIWRDHPLENADGCTYIVSDFGFATLTDEVRNCNSDEESLFYANHNRICDEGVEFLPDANAGGRCGGGTRDEESTAETGLTEADCITGGGTWAPYTCKDADDWLVFGATMDPAAQTSMIIENHWRPLCCADGDTEDVDGHLSDECPANYEFGSCSGYVPGLRCDYNHIYTGCTWDALQCTAILQCTCGDLFSGGDDWACMSLAMMPCENKPEGHPEGQYCDPNDPLPTGLSDGAANEESVVFVEDVDSSLSDECPANFELGSCSGYITDLRCDYNYIYTGCTWDDLQCTSIMHCTCEDVGDWSCVTYDMFCETIPEGLPTFHHCDPNDPLPTGPLDGAATTESDTNMDEADVEENSEDVGDELSLSTTEVSSACGLRRGAFVASASVVLTGLLWG